MAGHIPEVSVGELIMLACALRWSGCDPWTDSDFCFRCTPSSARPEVEKGSRISVNAHHSPTPQVGYPLHLAPVVSHTSWLCVVVPVRIFSPTVGVD
jgi:hypothetical protein